MRPGTSSEILTALEAAGITTALLVRMDFKNETIFVWTGAHALTVQGSTDTLLNNQTFDPLAHGVVAGMGDNAFGATGSEAFTISLGIPAAPSVAISAASVYPDEYQGRIATVWRALMIAQPGPDTPPMWAFRRVRTGAMDSLEIMNDGLTHTFTMSIESHASLISGASQSTYSDQTKFDPQDTSQNFVEACANGSPAPGPQPSGGWAGLAASLANDTNNYSFK